ncbi:hypothetical protein [Ammonifex thiophilus]|nr:hypothetical protein [Ammonifex thiophilus]
MNDLPDPSADLVWALRREGYEVKGSDIIPLGSAAALLPELKVALESKLVRAGLTTALAHLDEATDTLAQGQYGACAAAVRSFLQDVFDQWALRMNPSAGRRNPGGDRRRWLEKQGFLPPKEAALVKAFFEWLHQAGPHPGKPSESEAKAKFHIALHADKDKVSVL